MKILVDGFWWLEGPQSNRMVLVELITHWVRLYPDDELILAVRNTSTGASDAPIHGVEIVPTRLRLHPAINAIELPIIARCRSVDVVLAFNFAALSKHGVVFLHDVMFQSNPEWFTSLERVYFSAMPALARRARSVIATSETERQRIATYNPHLRRVVGCGLAISSALQSAAPIEPSLGLKINSFALCVGRLNVRKNLENTIHAMRRSGLISKSFPLVVIGEPSGRVANTAEFGAAIATGELIMADRLEESELKWLFMNCALFLCLSLDEGFGLPVVEAASFGAPVLASDIAVFRETLGSYGTFVDPTDTDAIAECARQMVADGAVREQYEAPFSWDSVCARIRNELQRVAGVVQ